MDNPQFSRRDFLRLAALSTAGLALSPRLTRLVSPAYCPTPPQTGQVLSLEQQRRLVEASQNFIAADIPTARQVALDIDFIEGANEDASTMCGPLAVAILQAAGLLGPWVSRHSFWLLNPRENLQPVLDTFPASLYEWYQFDDPIAEFDFSNLHLMAGDFLYLFAGPGDTFEHILVVNRVDDKGRPYTVSNFFIATGTIIEERLLYDLQAPQTGQFADWADRSLRNTMGNTGGGGFRIWRVKGGASLEFPTDTPSVELRQDMDGVLLVATGGWYGEIKRAGGPLLYQFNPYAVFHPASTIKVPIAMAFYHWLEGQHVPDWTAYLRDHGVQGRSYFQLLEAMLVVSEEDATETLVDFLGKDYLIDTWKGWGLDFTQIDPRRSSATDLASTMEQLYLGDWVSAASRLQMLQFMSAYTANDDTRLGRLRPKLPPGSVIYNKRGSLVDWPTVVADSGIIKLPGQPDVPYIFTLHGMGKNDAGYDDMENTLDQAIAAFGVYLTKVS